MKRKERLAGEYRWGVEGEQASEGMTWGQWGSDGVAVCLWASQLTSLRGSVYSPVTWGEVTSQGDGGQAESLLWST